MQNTCSNLRHRNTVGPNGSRGAPRWYGGTLAPRGLLCDGGSAVANSGYRSPYCTVLRLDGGRLFRGQSSLGPSSVKMRQLSPVPCSSQSNIFDVSADDLAPRNDTSIPLTRLSTTSPGTPHWTDHPPPLIHRILLPSPTRSRTLLQEYPVPEHPQATTRSLHAVSTLSNPV